jgi:Family of unknown function (DUF6526)
MPSAPTQNFDNHVKTVPLYNLLAFPFLFVNTVWGFYLAFTRPGTDTAIPALLGIALIVMFYYARRFALTVQDRVIRLETRLRLKELLPADLVARLPEFTTGQLIALRFASDRELPALARRVLDERLQDGMAIKRLITEWQPDHLRV